MNRFPRISPQISRAILASCLLISLFAAPGAQAALKPADGQRLKTIFTDMIARYANDVKAQGGSLITEGEVMVEPSDTYFAVTLPHITALNADQSRIKIGMISINALPGDKKEEWKMTVALPTPIVMQDAAGKETATLDIGSQNFAGLFHEQFQNFTRLNGQYKNIVFTDKVENAKITIPDLNMVYDLKEGANQLWSGPMNGKATGITGIFSKTGNTVKIREIDLKSSIKDYSAKEALAYQERVAALMESASADTPSASGQHAQGLYNMFFDFMSKVWDGFSTRISVNGIEVTRPATAAETASSLKIASAGLGLSGEGFRQNKVTLRHTLNVTGLSMMPPPAEFGKALPGDINIDLTLSNLPFKELIEMGQKSLSQSVAAPEGSGLVAMNALASAQQLLTNAGTSLTIKDTRVGNTTEYDVLLNGTATANIKAIFGVTGKARLEVFGMDKLIAYAQQTVNDPAADVARKAGVQKALQTLTILQMVGQMGKNAKGQDIRSYDLELTNEGKTMLNGADLMSVVGGLSGDSAKPTP